jgi:hypothetical protein
MKHLVHSSGVKLLGAGAPPPPEPQGVGGSEITSRGIGRFSSPRQAAPGDGSSGTLREITERLQHMAEKLGMFLTTSPEHENTHTVIKLAEAAMRRGAEVHIFLMCDGVHNAFIAGFGALADQGAHIVLCSHNLSERQRPKIEGAIVCGSQYDHAQLVSHVDRYLAFNA